MLCGIRLRLETYLIRFLSRLDSILNRFSFQNGQGFRRKIWDCKRYRAQSIVIFIQIPLQSHLEPIWKRFGSTLGSILGLFLEIIWMIEASFIPSKSYIREVQFLEQRKTYHLSTFGEHFPFDVTVFL